MSAGPLTLRCFLCRADNPEIRQSLTVEEILTVWRLAGLDFSEEIFQANVSTNEINLFRCRKCGFEFHDPRLAGNDRFYSELQAKIPGYYSPARPENRRNAIFAHDHGFRTILDIGCGTGAALDVAREYGLETFGIELNPAGAAETRARGHTVFSTLVEELEAHWNGKFDMISMNQLLEHVPDPIALVRDCIRLLSPRGIIAIAVPNSTGILRWHPWLALNWPPHHLSRWRRQDFYNLATRCELKIVTIGGNQLLGSEVELTLLDIRQHFFALKKRYHGLSSRLIKLLAFFYRKLGMKYLFRSQGHSIYCFLARKRGS